MDKWRYIMLPKIELPSLNPASLISGGIAAIFGSSDSSKDWRVRLSIPDIKGFNDSKVLKPLRDVGGLIFPYTPTIQLSHTANYSDVAVTHQNYQFIAYENSRADTITVSGPFNVEDGQQALYWVATLHFLRSATKMFAGTDADAGNPPPILKFNAYGEHVFNNLPVVVKSFSMDLPSDADYIPADDSVLGSVAGALGGAVGSAIGGLLGSAKTSRVPTKSTLTLQLQPVYSREAARQFSLTKFVSGGYVKTGGYV
jgi:hypothetical protein